MEKRIVYNNPEGGVSVLIPNIGCGLTVDQIAAKDVPTGLAYKIIDVSDVPVDRSARNSWEVDEADLTDGVGA